MKDSNLNNIKITPVLTYSNTEIDKINILNQNKNKAGIYIWKNVITGKSYVGSAIDLSKRLKFYFDTKGLKRVLSKESSFIYNAILKYGYINFSLDILEFCSKDIVLVREQYYIDTLNPEYNILKTAGSRFGSKHTAKTKKRISITSRGRKICIKANKANNEVLSKFIRDDTKRKLSLRCQGVNVKVYDKSNNIVNEFSSIKSCALYFGLTYGTISRIFDTGVSYDEFTYKFETKDLRIWVCDINYKLIEILENAKFTSIMYKIPRSTLSDYIKSGKLYKNKFYFYSYSETNPYYIK